MAKKNQKTVNLIEDPLLQYTLKVLVDEARHSEGFRSYGLEKLDKLEFRLEEMDKKIKQIEKTIKKDTGKEEKELKQLEKADKKRDKVCEMGEKMMKKKAKK